MVLETTNYRPEESNRSTLWQILVGIRDFQEAEKLPALKYSHRDCHRLGEVFSKITWSFPRRDIQIYADGLAENAINSEDIKTPLRDNIYQGIERVLSEAKSDDIIVFYATTHGIFQGNQSFLCTKDTKLDNLEKTAINLQDLLQKFLSKCAASKILLLLDACHSGKKIDKQSIERVIQDSGANQQKTLYALLSCDSNEESFEDDELQHGVFTHFLVKGLEGEAANQSDRIAVDELFDYIKAQTKLYIDKKNQQGKKSRKCQQNPQKISYGDNFIIAKTPISQSQNSGGMAETRIKSSHDAPNRDYSGLLRAVICSVLLGGLTLNVVLPKLGNYLYDRGSELEDKNPATATATATASDYYTWATRLNPKDGRAYNRLGMAKLDQGKPEAAEPYFEKSSELGDLLGCSNFAYIKITKYKDYDSAHRMLTSCLHRARQLPRDAEQMRTMVYLQKNMGLLWLEQRRFTEAINAVDFGLEIVAKAEKENINTQEWPVGSFYCFRARAVDYKAKEGGTVEQDKKEILKNWEKVKRTNGKYPPDEKKCLAEAEKRKEQLK
ncbi:C13 family peptidase [[Phormidium] sp. ETS-05]|uniref:C13 family peptidase n=1 Tax=[Phormidium] sp. ETS-05 TaxID=222819 RepID=UPI0018EF02F8|nr:C13 family peptidase [[Phormidium] sp. ETS-05]